MVKRLLYAIIALISFTITVGAQPPVLPHSVSGHVNVPENSYLLGLQAETLKMKRQRCGTCTFFEKDSASWRRRQYYGNCQCPERVRNRHPYTTRTACDRYEPKEPEKEEPMKVTEIVVSYGLTESLPAYGNVRVEQTRRATVEEGQDPKEIEERLYTQVREFCEQAVDTRLLQAGEPPIFYQGPRYRGIYNLALRIVAVVPELSEPPSDNWQRIGWRERGWTRDQAISRALSFKAERGEGWVLVDCTEGAEPMNMLEELIALRKRKLQETIEKELQAEMDRSQEDFIDEDEHEEWEDG